MQASGVLSLDWAQQEADSQPAWLSTFRNEALQSFEAADTPWWRRVSLKNFSLDAFTPARAAVTIEAGELPAGVIVKPLAQAMQEHGELVQRVLGTGVRSDRDAFAALNNALVGDGVFVYVPKETEVATPIRVRYSLDQGSTLLNVRTVALIERHSQVTIIEEFTGSAESAALILSGAELDVGDDATVTFNSVQNLPATAYNFGAQTINLRGKDSHAEWLSIVLGSAVQHITLDAQMLGNGSNVTWNGLLYGNRSQNLLVAPTLTHAGLNTEGQINFKTVVDDAAYAVFDGMVRIPHSGQGTNSDLRENALHLSSESRSDSIPGLEIDANEVKAGHGATSGQIDDEQLFYLMSRGLPRNEAKRTIVLGFVGEIVDLIVDESMRERIGDVVSAKV